MSNSEDEPNSEDERLEIRRKALGFHDRITIDESYVESDAVVDLTTRLRATETLPSSGDVHSDVYRGILPFVEHAHEHVAIKVLRFHSYNDETKSKIEKRLRRAIEDWKQLGNTFFLPLLGITYAYGRYPAIVYQLPENGSLTDYLALRGRTLSVDDRLQILCEVASGLSYLHGALITAHGELTSENVLVDKEGKMSLSVFGFSRIIAGAQSTLHHPSPTNVALRWSAPRIYASDGQMNAASVDKSCDIYSFGSLMLQVLTGQVPYHGLTDFAVVIALANGTTPERPSHSMADEHWNFIQECWYDLNMDADSVQVGMRSLLTVPFRERFYWGPEMFVPTKRVCALCQRRS